ncbi:cysteine proteinase [Parathielavia appendiculata]|uniref:ubiquitinyl hydrolase 1 n=1 Tax=Parathielavia appendiculata TaxID=2587402 RepID=A0AAN6Z4F1_9PEZI|nr:cysteine proteinase [Parathielavia appendiculata]
MAKATELGQPEKGGRLASRLVHDWLSGRPVADKEWRGQMDPALFQSEPPTECPPLRVFPPRPDAGHDHDLVIIPSQSYDDAHDPEGQGRSLLSCMCRYCRYHFVFHVIPSVREDATAHLQHHFRVQDTSWHHFEDSEVPEPCKQNPPHGQIQYACTVCGIAVHLDISSPRLKPMWIKMITDDNRIKESLRLAKERDPTRYADITPEKETLFRTSALGTLHQYLKNITDDDGKGPRKKISRRNKTFQVQFGRDCDHIFRYLGFEEWTDEVTGESYMLPPRLQPQEGKTPVVSLRAFFEDVRSEVQSLLDDKPPLNGQPVVKPISSARDQLEKALGCDRSHRSLSTLSISSSELPHFTTLGAPIDADDPLLKFAYIRQVETDSERAQAYLEALGTLAGRRSEDLQLFVFNQQEVMSPSQKREAAPGAADANPVDRAYAHFGLTKHYPQDPEYIIRVYRTYREQSPAQKADHRVALLEIGKDQDSQEIRDEVFGKPMKISEACQFLGVEPEWPMDSIAVTAQSLSSGKDLDYVDLILLALNTISNHLPADDPNRSAFEGVVAELRFGRLSQFTSSGDDHAGDTVSDPMRSHEAVDFDLPVGLGNLRNTCYLNSILQYFYSVNAVRNLAINTNLPSLEPTEANLGNILRTTTSNNSDGLSQSPPDLETGRAFVGHEFTRELSTLFRELDATGDSSIRPRQRLANAALLRPEKLRHRSADSEATQGASSNDAPPLPPRAAEGSISEAPGASTDVPMVDVERTETASSASSQQTLVNQPEGGGGPVTASEDRCGDKATAAAEAFPTEPTPSNPTVGGATHGGVKMSKLTVEELAAELDKPNVGSDQMDVDEVMGNAIDHLRAAFKVSSIGKYDAAPDPIEQAFFSTFIDNRKKIGEPDWNRTRRSDRWVTAYPAQSGTRDLYDALANSFDLEPLPGDLLSFTTIERPAPHFHICIQRSDGVRKNSNPITIPETLYLDRFMHIADTQSVLFKARKRKWDIKARLNELANPAAKEALETAKAESQVAGRSSNPGTRNDDLTEEEVDGFLVIGGLGFQAQVPSSMADVATGQSKSDGTGFSEELKQLLSKYNIEGPDIPQRGAAEPPATALEPAPAPPADLGGFWERFVAEENEERERLTAERDSLFGDAHSVAYRLHAVVCHAGSTASAGHYWVWIHDFERGVWRKYNDATVTVHPSGEQVLGELNSKGEPYYLAYVKADEVNELVSIPRRQPRPQQVLPPVPPRPERTSQDTVMADAGPREDMVASVEHLEDVEMEPPPYNIL